MPQSISRILIHVVFSTRDRRPLLDDSVRPRMHAYLATVARDMGCHCHRVGGTPDHVHIAADLARSVSAAKFVEHLKVTSSKWIKVEFPKRASFAWQKGYACFSASPKNLEALLQYVDNQKSHHAAHTFQEEVRRLLAEYRIEFDERYLWD